MGEFLGVSAAVLSSALGGTSVGATRFLVGAIDPLAIGALRFGLGFVFLLPVVAAQRSAWPTPGDRSAIAGLGLLFFALFPILFNTSLIFTTAARGGLALSTLPLLTMVVGVLLGVEKLTARKTFGVLVAMSGVALALLSGLSSAPPDAWRGDLLMVAAALCMALYSVRSRPYIRSYGAIPFTAMAMAVGSLCLIAISAARGSFAPLADFQMPQWLAVLYLGLIGGALTFVLWSFALGRTTPTQVAISVAVNPIAAALVGTALLGEPIGWNLAAGVVAVFVGIWIATSSKGRAGAPN